MLNQSQQGGSKMGRPKKSLNKKYQSFHAKFPPYILKWLRAQKVKDRKFSMNDFIVKAVAKAIAEGKSKIKLQAAESEE